MQEILSNTWAILGISFGGVSLLTIICTVLWFCLKSAFNRAIRKMNIEKICEDAYKKGFNAGVERVREITFKHSIEPLVISNLQKSNEYSVAIVKEELGKTQAKYDKLVAIIEKLSNYFDNSIGVPEEKKAELKEAIANAKSNEICEQVIESEQVVVEEQKSEKQAEKSPKKDIKVER